MSKYYKVKVSKTKRNITKWLEPRDMVMTVDGEMTNAKWCHEEAERQEGRGRPVVVKEQDGMIAVLHPEELETEEG